MSTNTSALSQSEFEYLNQPENKLLPNENTYTPHAHVQLFLQYKE